MELQSTAIESFLKSVAFNVLLCLVWGTFSVFHGERLLHEFDLTELLWFVYNVTVSLLFLVRVRPSIVSMNLVHWVVALVTSFSGFFFSNQGANTGPVQSSLANLLTVSAILLGIGTAIILGRSYDFLPAVRQLKTQLYLSSIAIKLAYVLKNPSIYNACLLVIFTVLYDRRAKYEEEIMSRSDSYVHYCQKVKYRFIPRLY
jgi:hypothetical protein